MTRDEREEFMRLACKGCTKSSEECVVCKLPDALNKQIKQVPIVAKMYTEYGWVGYCPRCGEGINSDMKYCSECGQAIGWEHLDKEEN